MGSINNQAFLPVIAAMIYLLAQEETAYPWLPQVIASVAVFAAALLLRWALRRGLQSHHKMSPDMKRRWLLQIRNLAFVLIAAGADKDAKVE